MDQQPLLPESKALPHDIRAPYWGELLNDKHKTEMRILLREAKLGKKPKKIDGQWEGWNNVIKHQAGEAAAFILGKFLKQPQEQVERQETFALVHDAEKHAQVKPGDFTVEEKTALDQKLQPIFQRVDPDGSLRIATNEAFFYKLFEQTEGKDIDEKIARTSQAELLQYYIDSIFVDGQIVPALERITKTEARRQDLNDDPVRTGRLGMKYWDAERIVAVKVQERIWEWLKEAGTLLPSPDAIPAFIDQKIEEEMVAHWLKIRGNSLKIDVEKESPLTMETLCDTKRKSSELNEDTGLVQQKGTVTKIGVWDGATGIGRDLTPSGGKIAAIVCREAAANAPAGTTPRDMLLQGNALLRTIATRLPLTPTERMELLTAVGAVGTLDTQTMKLDYASVADCHIFVLHPDGTGTWLSTNTSVDCERVEIAAAVWGAEHPGEPLLPEDSVLFAHLDEVMKRPLEKRPAIQPLADPRVIDIIGRNRRLENKPGGQPSLKGTDDDAICNLIKEGSFAVQTGDQIFFMTDGGYPGPLYTTDQQAELMAVVREGGIQGLHAWVRAQEDADPQLKNPPRMKQYDDLIALRVEVPEVSTKEIEK